MRQLWSSLFRRSGYSSSFQYISAVLRRIAAEVFFHFFATIAIVALAAPGVTSWQTICYVGLGGLIIDIIRHAASPECRITPAQVWHQVTISPAINEKFQKEFRFWKGVWGASILIWIGCTVILAIAANQQRDGHIAPRFGFFAPLEAVDSALLSIDRRAVTQLHQHGFQEQADAASLFFAINLAFFVLFLGIMFSGLVHVYTRSVLSEASRRQATLDGNRVCRLLAGMLLLLVLAVFAQFMFSNVFYLRWEGTGHSFWWALPNSSMPFIYFSTVEATISSMIFLAYLFSVLARCVAHRPQIFSSTNRCAQP